MRRSASSCECTEIMSSDCVLAGPREIAFYIVAGLAWPRCLLPSAFSHGVKSLDAVERGFADASLKLYASASGNKHMGSASDARKLLLAQ